MKTKGWQRVDFFLCFLFLLSHSPRPHNLLNALSSDSRLNSPKYVRLIQPSDPCQESNFADTVKAVPVLQFGGIGAGFEVDGCLYFPVLGSGITSIFLPINLVK